MSTHLKGPEKKAPGFLDEWSNVVLAASLTAAVISVVWLATPLYLTKSLPPHEILTMEKRGQHGDSFGAVNALFTGLAFAGVIMTILLQRRELQLQREELEMTREVMKLQQNDMSASAAAQERIAKFQEATAKTMGEATRFQVLNSAYQLLKPTLAATQTARNEIESSQRFHHAQGSSSEADRLSKLLADEDRKIGHMKKSLEMIEYTILQAAGVYSMQDSEDLL